VLNNLAMLARLTRDAPRSLRTPITAEQAAAVVKRRLATREARFLGLLERAVYGHPASPYRQLLLTAGCELGDLETLVAQEGLEGTLARLLESGVYLTFDEFKGRKAAVRGSQRLEFSESDFDNPRLAFHVEARSGGTRGAGTSVKIALPYVAQLAASTALAFDVHDLWRHDHAIWLHGGFAGIIPMLLYAKLGRGPIAWFYPVEPLPTKAHLGARYLSVLGRRFGHRLPVPAFFDLQDPGRMATWLADRVAEGSSIYLTTYASSAVRVSLAAAAMRRSLDRVCFITLGEPFTDAKQEIVTASGARALVRYAFTEAGIIGYRCGTPEASDDLHLFTDCYGVIQRSRAVQDADATIQAILYTSLLAKAPKILLNVESGDYGLIERRECGCGFGALGLHDHISRIRSFEKLSGEGQTFVQADLLRVLEEALPARFGGTSADYQVLEEEGHDGILRLILVVSPVVGPVDEAALRQTFLDELGRDGGYAPLAAGIWRRAGTVVVRRQMPVATKAGKILPFHLVKAQGLGPAPPR
jgi:hypothetical protein